MKLDNVHELEACPKCKARLVDRYLTKEEQDSGNWGDTRFFSKLIALYDRDLDRTVAFQCPSCKHQWKRK